MVRSRREVATALSFDPEGEGWRYSFLREVGERLGRLPVGCAALFEQSSDDREPWLIPSDPIVVRSVELAAAAVPGQLRRVTPVPLPDPPGRDGLRWVRIAPVLGVASSVGEAGPGETTDGLPFLPYRPHEPTEVPSIPWRASRALWRSTSTGRLRVRVELLIEEHRPGRPELAASEVARVRRHLDLAGFPASRLGGERRVPTIPRAWRTGRFRGSDRRFEFEVSPASAAMGVHARRMRPSGAPLSFQRHLVAVGASGSGKTGLLAHLAVEAVRGGARVVAIDLHGDLTPRVSAALDPAEAARLVAIDPSQAGPDVGVDVLGGSDLAQGSRRAAQVVATLRRLSSDGGDLYWGFRLERLFDVFVRLAAEEGGSLVDLYGLLTDERRREASRLSTRSPVVARFLEELSVIVRRNPEFLWGAAARLEKVVHDHRLASLLAPRSGGIDPSALLAEGRSLLIRLPVGEFGPEAAGFAASLLVGRVYHALLSADGGALGPRPTVFLLDEAHLFAPRVLLDLIAEGRKFGVCAVLATQVPERLAPDLRAAVEGSVGTHVVFRIPRPSVPTAARWLGLEPPAADRLLPALPAGVAVVSPSGWSVERQLVRVPLLALAEPESWRRCVARTAHELGVAPGSGSDGSFDENAEEAVLLAAYVAEELRRPLCLHDLAARAVESLGTGSDGRTLHPVVERLLRRGWLGWESDRVVVGPAGRRRLGLDRPTGATRESEEHRRLLFEAFRIFALKDAPLEILRQGRFDRRLPDALFRQIPGNAPRAPRELAEAVDRARHRWAWTYFGGRDVFVEAEVSGAVRPERVRRGLEKAASSGAYALFLSADAPRARRIRETLARDRVPPSLARVWTLRLSRLPQAPAPLRLG